MDEKKKIIRFLIGFAIFLLIIICILPFFRNSDDKTDDTENEPSQSEIDVIEFEGKKYTYNYNLYNILFLGIDNDEEIREEDIPGQAGQSDVILILSLNKETKEASILQVPRDTITEIDIYDGNGNRYDSAQAQITLQYAYASGGQTSCWAVKKTVSELLYDLQIDGYVALDIAGVSLINDAIGGVTLTIPEDYTDIDPAFEEGVTITLTGEQAHNYIRYRDIEESFSNQGRMERQMQYIPALIDALKSSVDETEEYYDVFYPIISKYVLTDMKEDQLNEFSNYKLTTSDSIVIPGEWVSGENHDEYHVKEDELKKMIIETFYVVK